MEDKQPLELIKRIKALADTGLVYADDEYHRERYEELREIGLQLLSKVSDRPISALRDFYMPVVDYPTPKVDVRGLVLNGNTEILMTQEQEDGHWTIPGGWADVGFTPTEMIVREIEEETGLKTSVIRLLAVYDKKCHPHPPQPLYIYKLNFLCKIEGGVLEPGFDMKDAAFFPISNLPELSQDRILESQLQQLYRLAIEGNMDVYVD
ncbi:NUDIX hydrolase [Flavobacteriaceae bacterium F89]|uniref:NUDIX hydrolase n=1 Tax=Cerina litoralis TaxID=2874477 RepID=A0AAE3JQD5_9FLAO|nr:NUDIX hydrolase [Cerina litoralis]MCG2460138.1 NUDIX hydrolase [Cerina litoralis]